MSHTFLYQIFRIFLSNLHNLQTISHRSICTIAFLSRFLCCSVKFHIKRWFDFPRKNSDSKWRKAKLLSQTEEGSISLFLSACTILYSFPTTFFFIFFSTGISPVVFKSSTSTYPNYQPPLLLENQTWPLFEILKHWEILIRSVIKDFNSRLLCPPPALNGKVLKISKYRPNHICNALPYFLFKLWLPLLPPTKDICKMIMLCQISELCLSFCWKAIPGGKNKK